MERTSNHPASGLLAGLGLATGIGAVFAASCCVLPLALGALGAGVGVFSALEFLADYRMPILIASAVLVAAAWVVYWRRRGAARTAVALCLASVLVITAAGWDYLEPPLLKMIYRTSR